jgi:hypothetical protein
LNPNVQAKIKQDPVQLQLEARELLDLSQSLQLDIESVSRGPHPKDTIEKLKRIQKLAMRLRREIERRLLVWRELLLSRYLMREASSPSDSFVEELRHQFQRLFSFRQLEVIPEGMRQRVENNQARVNPRLQ